MRLKGVLPAFAGGICKGFVENGELPNTPTQPKYPCSDYFAADSAESDCTCCIDGLCTSEGHPEITGDENFPPVVQKLSEACSGLTRSPNTNDQTPSTTIPDAYKCRVRCSPGWSELFSRHSGVWYECPYWDLERGQINQDAIRLIPSREYSGPDYESNGAQDWGRMKISCRAQSCPVAGSSTTFFQNPEVQAAAVADDQVMAAYETSSCKSQARTFDVKDRSRCTVNCGAGYAGMPMIFACSGTNDPLNDEEPAAHFLGMDPDDGDFASDHMPTCTAVRCTSWGTPTWALPSPFNRYDISACATTVTDTHCTVPCKPGYTPENYKLYSCFNRAYKPVGRVPDIEEVFGFVPKSLYDEKKEKILVAASSFLDDQLEGPFRHLKCPAQMCKFDTLPLPRWPIGTESHTRIQGIDVGDCFGTVAEGIWSRSVAKSVV